MIKNPLYLEKELLKFLITHIPQDNWHKKRNSLRQQKVARRNVRCKQQ